MNIDISVIITTYNRDRELYRTINSIAKNYTFNKNIEYIIVDNDSKDDTRRVIESLSKQIPIRYIFESRSGKNWAINAALEKCLLGKIIVFTDDDVDVPHDWLSSIWAACERWPNHVIFGGRIDVIFPTNNIPQWAYNPFLASIAFAKHDYSNEECIYSPGVTPFGANYWVRREIFANGRRFNPQIGPRPSKRISGSEASFLVSLLNEGHQIVYSPYVKVEHRIMKETLNIAMVYRRAYRWGRGKAHIYKQPEQTRFNKIWPNLNKNPMAWRTYRISSVILYSFKVLISFILSNKKERPENVAKRIEMLGYRMEALSLLKENR